jgi:hypothetical protein
MVKPEAKKCRLQGSLLRGDVCGIVAVIAISGKSEAEARAAISSAAAERGQSVVPNFDTSQFCDQARALEILGGILSNMRNEPIQARNMRANRQWKKKWLGEQPTIAQFLEWYSRNGCPDRMLVHATGPLPNGTDLASHTFALDRGRYFDNNTVAGKPVEIREAIKSALAMRVVDVLRVQRPPGRRKKVS